MRNRTNWTKYKIFKRMWFRYSDEADKAFKYGDCETAWIIISYRDKYRFLANHYVNQMQHEK